MMAQYKKHIVCLDDLSKNHAKVLAERFKLRNRSETIRFALQSLVESSRTKHTN